MKTEQFAGLQSWILDMMKVMDAILSYCKHVTRNIVEQPHSYDAIYRLCVKLWETCSSRRDVFLDNNRLEDVIPGLGKQLRVSLRNIIYSHVIFRRYI